jgi:DNA-binding NtrC family response regulator
MMMESVHHSFSANQKRARTWMTFWWRMNEKILLTLRNTVLERTGHEVVLADNGEKGINVFNRPCPFITILDLHLPDVDGTRC